MMGNRFRDKEVGLAYVRERARKLAIQEEAELKIAVEQSVGSWFHESELAESEVSFATTSDRWHLEALDSARR